MKILYINIHEIQVRKYFYNSEAYKLQSKQPHLVHNIVCIILNHVTLTGLPCTIQQLYILWCLLFYTIIVDRWEWEGEMTQR